MNTRLNIVSPLLLMLLASPVTQASDLPPSYFQHTDFPQLENDGSTHKVSYSNGNYDLKVPMSPGFNKLSLRLEGGDGGSRVIQLIGDNRKIGGGEGATIIVDFSVGENRFIPPGAIIRFIVGEGASKKKSGAQTGASGGGGTAVFMLKPDYDGEWTLLAVAGGGGGAWADLTIGSPGGPGRTETTGQDGGGSGASGGHNGHNGTVGAVAGYSGFGIWECWPGGEDDKDKTQQPTGNVGQYSGGEGHIFGCGAGGINGGTGYAGGGGGYSGGGGGGGYKRGGGGGSYSNPSAIELRRIKNDHTKSPGDGFVEYNFYQRKATN